MKKAWAALLVSFSNKPVVAADVMIAPAVAIVLRLEENVILKVIAFLSSAPKAKLLFDHIRHADFAFAWMTGAFQLQTR